MAIVARMNRVGMAVDISHCADRTSLDAIEASERPVLITHSNCRKLVPNSSRCKTDETIRRWRKGRRDGSDDGPRICERVGPATIDTVLDHVDHIARLVGVEHVGVGSDVDLDGRDWPSKAPRKYDLDGIDYSKKIFDLTEGLVRRNYSSESIGLILGGILRGHWGRCGFRSVDPRFSTAPCGRGSLSGTWSVCATKFIFVAWMNLGGSCI